METPSITNNKIEQIQIAIQHLIESQQTLSDEEHQLLAKLLSQLKSLKEDELNKQSERSAEPKEVFSGGASEVELESEDAPESSESKTEIGAEDVVNQMKKLEKQNKTTHWLLSALIVLTIAWQVSEVSLLLKLKDGISHPLKSVGKVITGMIKRPKQNDEAAEKSSLLGKKVNGSENSLKLPNMDLSNFINGDEE